MKSYRTFACDFETTVYKGQKDTAVWSSACVELGTENVLVFGDIQKQFDYFISLKTNILAYYHNLRFDGMFWLSYLIEELHFKQAYEVENPETMKGYFLKDHEMPEDSFKYMISEMGQWYTITIRTNKHYIVLRDSLKLLPFSLKTIGQSFKTKHQKLDMEYEGFRYPNCYISPKEMEYIKNDVLVLKEALEFMFSEGHKKLTIGSCCLEEFKTTLLMETDWEQFFPNLYDIEIDEDTFGSKTAGDYIKKSYRGGWCYVAKGKEDKIFNNGCTADVNSLYPSMMSSESGNYYPLGKPTFFTKEIPDICIHKQLNKTPMYYFIRIRTRFKIKKDKLPFIQIKNTFKYKGNECLETSDVLINGKYYEQYIDLDGTINDGRITLTMTMTDYKLFLDHYDVYDFEILDGCYFYTEKGIFDSYINKYKKIKMNSKGAMRELAKLFLNNLYGKMATSTNSSFKLVMADEDGVLHYKTITEYKKKPGYIAIGSAITSYARNFTIRAAQANYYGKDNRGFIYADTDSIHCDLSPDEIKGIRIDDRNFCCWKIESEWDIGYFNRQKTYIEHLIKKDSETLSKPYYEIKCAGMPAKCKYLFNLSIMQNATDEEKSKLTKEERVFIEKKRTIADFKQGLTVPGKLLPKRIKGGIILTDTEYTFR